MPMLAQPQGNRSSGCGGSPLLGWEGGGHPKMTRRAFWVGNGGMGRACKRGSGMEWPQAWCAA